MLASMDEGKASAAKAEDISQLSFEQALGALEDIVKQLERGDVPLDQSITLYERGEALRAACQSRLDAAQARIERIVTNASGAATAAQPFDTEG